MNVAETQADHPHLLVVDDDARLRDLLQRYLTVNGFRVTAAADAVEARALMKSLTFDALVLDVMLPGESGFELAAALRQDSSEVPILMLTARGEAEDRIQGLEQGADDYLGKPFEPRELMLRLGALLRRTRAPRQTHRLVRMGGCVFDLERGELKRHGKPIRLTGSEAQLLKLFTAAPGRTFTRAALCAKLNIALERSIDVQVTRLRRKIEEDPKLPLYVQTVRGIGYVLVPDRIE